MNSRLDVIGIGNAMVDAIIPSNPKDLKYGVSITDLCIGWDETEILIKWAYNEL